MGFLLLRYFVQEVPFQKKAITCTFCHFLHQASQQGRLRQRAARRVGLGGERGAAAAACRALATQHLLQTVSLETFSLVFDFVHFFYCSYVMFIFLM